MNYHAGMLVSLVKQDEGDMDLPSPQPPIGAIGMLVAWDSSDMSWEVDFPGHSWSEADPTWFYPASYLKPIKNTEAPDASLNQLEKVL